MFNNQPICNMWKIKIFIKSCEISMHCFKTQANLNILQLGSYDALIGMGCLEKYNVILNLYEKNFTYVWKHY
jgi:hypothetical protein